MHLLWLECPRPWCCREIKNEYDLDDLELVEATYKDGSVTSVVGEAACGAARATRAKRRAEPAVANVNFMMMRRRMSLDVEIQSTDSNRFGTGERGGGDGCVEPHAVSTEAYIPWGTLAPRQHGGDSSPCGYTFGVLER